MHADPCLCACIRHGPTGRTERPVEVNGQTCSSRSLLTSACIVAFSLSTSAALRSSSVLSSSSWRFALRSACNGGNAQLEGKHTRTPAIVLLASPRSGDFKETSMGSLRLTCTVSLLSCSCCCSASTAWLDAETAAEAHGLVPCPAPAASAPRACTIH
jgi:hypothetical protein